MRKLSPRQRDVLKYIHTVGPRYVHRLTRTQIVLIRLGLAEWKDATLRITDAGRQALEGGGAE